MPLQFNPILDHSPGNPNMFLYMLLRVLNALYLAAGGPPKERNWEPKLKVFMREKNIELKNQQKCSLLTAYLHFTESITDMRSQRRYFRTQSVDIPRMFYWKKQDKGLDLTSKSQTEVCGWWRFSVDIMFLFPETPHASRQIQQRLRSSIGTVQGVKPLFGVTRRAVFPRYTLIRPYFGTP